MSDSISPTPGATFVVQDATVTGCRAQTAGSESMAVLLHCTGAWNTGAADVLDILLDATNLKLGAAGIGLQIVVSAHACHEQQGVT